MIGQQRWEKYEKKAPTMRWCQMQDRHQIRLLDQQEGEVHVFTDKSEKHWYLFFGDPIIELTG